MFGSCGDVRADSVLDLTGPLSYPHTHSQQRHKPRLTYHQQQYQRQYRSFVVKFDSPDEAQRAIREKQAEQWGQGKVHIVSYK